MLKGSDRAPDMNRRADAVPSSYVALPYGVFGGEDEESLTAVS